MTESKIEQAYREGMEAGLAFGIGYSAAEKGIKPHSTNTNAAFLYGYEAVITGYWPSKRSVPYTADVLWEEVSGREGEVCMINLGDPALIAVGLPVETAQIAPSHAHMPIKQRHNALSLRLQPIADH